MCFVSIVFMLFLFFIYGEGYVYGILFIGIGIE